MKTRKRVVIWMTWRDRQHQHHWQWVVILSTMITVWLGGALNAWAATKRTKAGVADLCWVARQRQLNLESLGILVAIVIVGLTCWLRARRAHRTPGSKQDD